MLIGTTVGSFAWAPDSGHLFYLSDKANKGMTELYVCAPDGSGQQVKASGTLPAGAGVMSATWSYDGTWLAFVRWDGLVAPFELYTVQPDGTSLAKVSGPIVSDATGVALVVPSPDDGTRFAFVAEKDVVGTTELYLVGVGGTGLTKVSPPGASGAPGVSFSSDDVSWSTDGSALAFLFRGDAVGPQELSPASPPGRSSAPASTA